MKKPLIIVPDASIIIAYFLKEKEHKKQIDLFFNQYAQGKIQCCVPHLLYYEVSNRLSKIKKQNFDLLFFNQHDSAFCSIESNLEQTKIAFKLCQKYPQISFYDASYHALAIFLDGVFLTADKKYYQLTKKQGNIQFIKNY